MLDQQDLTIALGSSLLMVGGMGLLFGPTAAFVCCSIIGFLLFWFTY